MLHDPEHITALMSGLSVCMLFICVPAFSPPNRKEFPCQDLAQASKDLDPPTQALTWCSSGWIEIRSNLILFLHNYFMVLYAIWSIDKNLKDSGWLFVLHVFGIFEKPGSRQEQTHRPWSPKPENRLSSAAKQHNNVHTKMRMSYSKLSEMERRPFSTNP